MLHFRKTHGARFGLSDLIGGSPRTMADLIAITSNLPTDPTRVILSQIQILLANEEATDFERHMRTHHLGEEAIKNIEQFSAEKNVNISLFSEMSILLVQETFRQHHGSTTTAGEIKTIIPKISEAILVANDICNNVLLKPDENAANPDVYTTFALPEMLFNYSDQFRYAIGRSYLIYEGLKERCRKEFVDDFFDVNTFFQEKMKITLDDYFFSIFAVFANWGSFSFSKIEHDRNFINTDSWIPEENARKRINAVIALFEEPWQKKTTLSATSNPEAIRAFLYEHFHLRQFPLLRVQEGLICGSLLRIQSKYWDGPYYEVIANGSSGEKDRFFRFLGRTTEMYVQGLLKDGFKNNFKQIKAASGNPIADAAVFINPSWCVLFEVKAKRPTKEMISSGDAPAEMKAVAQMAFEGLQQMSDRITELRTTGFNGRITPIMVTGGHFPINALMWKHYLQKVMTLPMMNDSKIDLPQFMNLESLEVFTALKKVCRIGELLREKLSDDWKTESFQTFLFAHYLPTFKIVEPFNKVSASLYQDRMAAMTLSLFPTEVQKVPPHSDWRKAFSIE